MNGPFKRSHVSPASPNQGQPGHEQQRIPAGQAQHTAEFPRLLDMTVPRSEVATALRRLGLRPLSWLWFAYLVAAPVALRGFSKRTPTIDDTPGSSIVTP